MKLWAFDYESDGPRTHWAATKREALVAMKELEDYGPRNLRGRELPKSKGSMATWLNKWNVESWQ